MTYRISFIAASLFALAPFAATAGNLAETVIDPAPTPAPVAATPQLSVWNGFYAGGQIGTGDATDEDNSSLNPDFNIYGVHAGYMYDLGSLVLGAELDYNIVNVDVANELDFSLSHLKLRAGYDAGRFLPYATVGVARFSVDDDLGIDSVTETGFAYGLGVAYAASDKFIIGAEYLRSTIDDDGGDVDLDAFSLRASYKF